MVFTKRVIIATILGVIFGFICFFGMKSGGRVEVTTAMAASTILSRALMGFAIGISGWRIHYLLHGAIMGLIFSLPLGVYAGVMGFIMFAVAGIIYGLLIELITTKLFKAGMKVEETD